MGVATTHSQYFALDLENHYANNTAVSSPTIYNPDGSMASQPVVWYTLNSGSEDSKGYYDYNGQDAMSNYYIYSFAFVVASNLIKLYKKDRDFALQVLKELINIDLKVNAYKYYQELENLDLVTTDGLKNLTRNIKRRCK